MGRKAKDNELTLLSQAFEGHRKRFASDPEAAEELLSVGESPRNRELNPIDHAALAVVANLIMNLDEFVTRE
jgi:hypothetical protein